MAQDPDKPVDMIEVALGGKSLLLTEDEFKKIVKNTLDRVAPYAKSLRTSHKVCADIYEDYLKTAQIENGLMKAVGLAVSMAWSDIKIPSATLMIRADQAIKGLEAAVSGGKISGLASAIEAAEAAVNGFRDDLYAFVEKVGASALKRGTALKITSAVGFTVIGALGASILVAGGATAATAAALSAASAKTLENQIDLLARAINGEDVSFLDGVKNNAVDSLVAAASGSVGAKVDAKLLAGPAKTLAKQIGARMTYFAAPQVEAMVAKVLASAGATAIPAASSAAVDLMGESAKKGKVPTSADFAAAFEKFLIETLSGGALSGIEGAEKALEPTLQKLAESKLVPDLVKSLAKTMPASPEMKTVASETWKATKGELMKAGASGIAGSLKGNENATQLADLGVKGVERDSAVRRLLEAETKKVLAKRKIPLK